MNRLLGVAAAISAVVVFGPLPQGHADPGGEYVRTQSGKVRCWVTAAGQMTSLKGPAVICEASGPTSPPFDQWENIGFTQAPLTSYGWHYHNAMVDSLGNFSFQDGGNIGGAYPEEDIVLRYGATYRIQGWTIEASPGGTRFTNNATGHGMFVSIENVYAF